MKITTRIKSSWVELTIEDGSATINCDIWKNELVEVKAMLENAIDDIDHMIEKTQEENDKQ
jgi:hypothetical protein